MKKFLIAMLMLAPLSLSAQKFAHFNLAEVIPNMAEYTKAQEEIQTMTKQFEDDMKLMQDELEKKSAEYQKEQAKLLDNVRARREQELQDLYQRLQQSYQDNQQALAKVQAEKMQEINDIVLAAVKKVGENGGYVYIVDISGGAIPFVNPAISTDVTNEIKKEVGIK